MCGSYQNPYCSSPRGICFLHLNPHIVNNTQLKIAHQVNARTDVDRELACLCLDVTEDSIIVLYLAILVTNVEVELRTCGKIERSCLAKTNVPLKVYRYLNSLLSKRY